MTVHNPLRRREQALFAGLVVGLGLASVALGGPPLTHAQFVAKANAICAKNDANTLPFPDGEPNDPETVLTNLSDGGVGLVRREVVALLALNPPVPDRPLFEQLKLPLQRLLKASVEAAAAHARHDTRRVSAADFSVDHQLHRRVAPRRAQSGPRTGQFLPSNGAAQSPRLCERCAGDAERSQADGQPAELVLQLARDRVPPVPGEAL
jgi:hypothetical protein